MASKNDSLYADMPRSLTTAFANLENQVRSGLPVFPGTAGNLRISTNGRGEQFHARRWVDGGKNRRDEYIGLLGQADDKAAAIGLQLNEVKEAVSQVRMLIREGYQFADPMTYATLATLHLHGLFTAGACLVGSHAYGALLNQMGIRAQAYATEDIDVARREALALPSLADKSFLEILRDSGIDFVEIPRLNRKEPSTSFKELGRSQFHVDLLVPATGDSIGLAPVPELKAHAATMPYLAYLLGKTQMATLISREGLCHIRVPVPERFAIHKLVVSQLRLARDEKVEKDQQQAAVLLAGLHEKFPGAVAEAIADLPVSALSKLRRAAQQIQPQMQGHAEAWEELSETIPPSKGKQ